MAKKRDIHVLPHPEGGWMRKKECASRAGSRHTTKKEADAAGRAQAKREKVELVTHGKDGKIQDSDSYGNDPHPPKDKIR